MLVCSGISGLAVHCVGNTVLLRQVGVAANADDAELDCPEL